jgi:hypothetical protein
MPALRSRLLVRLHQPLAAAVTRGDPAAAAPAKTIGGAGLDGAGIGRPFTLDKVVLGRYFRR